MSEKEKDIGALWEKRTQKGAPMLTGQVTIRGEVIKIVVFKNGYKKEDRHPDWRIFLSTPREDAPQYGSNDQGLADMRNPAHKSSGIEYPAEEIDPNDIPF